MVDIKKSAESLNDDRMDGVSGGNGGHIEYIICPTCGYEIRLKGWYTNICPRWVKRTEETLNKSPRMSKTPGSSICPDESRK